MPQINNSPIMRTYKHTPRQAVESKEPPDKKLSNTSKVVIGTGAVALAATGIYLVSRGKNQNIDNVFKQLQKSDTFMPILSNTKLKAKEFKNLMFKLTKDETLSEKFINEVISHPEKSKENVRILNKKIGGDKELMDWMLKPNGYQEAYTKYTKKIYNNAKTPDELVQISPNWNIWKMKDKFGPDFVLGELPKDICNGDINKFRNIFNNALLNAHAGYETEGFKFGEYILGGLSGKAVRSFETNGKKYIMKFQPNLGNVDLNDNISMKSDSAFLNSQLDRFLQLNHFEQGAKFKLFDNKTNMALYEMTEGVKPSEEMLSDILKTNESLNGLNSLGVYYNDINTSNFLIDKDNKLSFIDSGEASFIDFFKPGVEAYHFSLPNLNGKSITDTAAAINLSK
ncbi:MAG: hypothetical protein ACI4S3_06990 [Candidatus Gastranaerophilaceae bacterium]